MVGMDKFDSSHRCSSSIPAVFLYVVVRPLMLRIKAGMNLKDSDAGLVLLVILSALCFLLLSSNPDARHLGRYGPDGQVCSTSVWPRSSSNAAVAYLAGFAGDDIYAVYSLLLSSAGPDGPEGPLRVFLLFTRPLCATTGAMGCGVQKTAEFPQLLSMQVVDISFVVQRPISMVLVTMEIPQLRVDTVVDGPFLQSCNSLS